MVSRSPPLYLILSIVASTLFEGYGSNGIFYLLANKTILQGAFTMRFLRSVNAILCAVLREFEKLFGRNKECEYLGD
jgi:hypothetical protein